MQPKPIDLLQRLLSASDKDRLLDLLKDPDDSQSPQGWYMYIPSCFNDALDIKKTPRVHNKEKTLIWTQGKQFSFKRGDTLYDTQLAYEKQWSQALKAINRCVTITDAQDVTPSQPNEPRNPGFASFSISVPNKNKTNLIKQNTYTLTQDDFIKFLIQGFPNKQA